jgi:hypothetical protein
MLRPSNMVRISPKGWRKRAFFAGLGLKGRPSQGQDAASNQSMGRGLRRDRPNPAGERS